MSERDDLLTRATTALHDEGAPDPEALARLRARVVGAEQGVDTGARVVPLGRSRPFSRMRWLLPLAAVFAAATALAATPSAWRALEDVLERYLPFAVHAPERAVVVHRRRPAPATPPAAPPVATPPTLAAPSSEGLPVASAAPPSSAADVVAPRVRAERAGLRASVRPTQRGPHTSPPAAAASAAGPLVPAPLAPSAAPAGESSELAGYRRAHSLQFRARDYGAALAAWDAYLAATPHGTLHLEARYNRAVCLIASGRYAEARAALSSFAAGREPGAYKQAEARALLGALP